MISWRNTWQEIFVIAICVFYSTTGFSGPFGFAEGDTIGSYPEIMHLEKSFSDGRNWYVLERPLLPDLKIPA